MMYPKESNPFYNAVAPHQWSVCSTTGTRTILWCSSSGPMPSRYWMEAYNVDGYRFDLVKGLGDNESYAAAGGTDQYNQSRIDRMIRLRGVIKSVKPNGIHINELLGGARERQLSPRMASCSGPTSTMHRASSQWAGTTAI